MARAAMGAPAVFWRVWDAAGAAGREHTVQRQADNTLRRGRRQVADGAQETGASQRLVATTRMHGCMRACQGGVTD